MRGEAWSAWLVEEDQEPCQHAAVRTSGGCARWRRFGCADSGHGVDIRNGDATSNPAIAAGTENQPVYVHCSAGKGRTGVFVGANRMAVDGWSSDAAYEEARSVGVSSSKRAFFEDFGELLASDKVAHYPHVR